MGGPLDTMRSLEQFLPGDQPRGFMGPDSGPKGKFWIFKKKHSSLKKYPLNLPIIFRMPTTF